MVLFLLFFVFFFLGGVRATPIRFSPAWYQPYARKALPLLILSRPESCSAVQICWGDSSLPSSCGGFIGVIVPEPKTHNIEESFLQHMPACNSSGLIGTASARMQRSPSQTSESRAPFLLPPCSDSNSSNKKDYWGTYGMLSIKHDKPFSA